MPGRSRRDPGGSSVRSARPLAAIAIVAPAMVACDPIWSISGAFFPAWLLCMVGGVIAAALIRVVIVRAGLDPYIGPRLAMYLMLCVACICTLWLAFFGR